MDARNNTLEVIGRVAALGFAAGLRSQVPLALLALTASDGGPDMLRRRWLATPLYLSAAGEVVVDKLPVLPSRLSAGPLAGRVMFGAFSGALLARRRGVPLVAGALTGGFGALAGSYAGFHARTYLGASSGVPDFVWAGLEDAVTFTIGIVATRA